jgi:DNA-binding NarL/FixJ family response regulator
MAYVPMSQSYALGILADAERRAGMLDEARAHATQLAEASRAGEDWWQLTVALVLLASIDRVEGELGRAEADVHEALGGAHRLRLRSRVIDGLEMLAWIASDLGSVEEAARLVGASSAARDATGYGRDLSRREAGIAALRETMGDAAFDTAVAEGRSLSLDAAVAYARRGRGERKRPATGWASLTPMEVQVVDLIREGRTNAEIGEQLYVSPRTVQAHLSRIYTKLGVNGRTALAALPVKEGQ